MAIVNGYIALTELQGHLHSNGMPVTFTPADVVNMELAIEAVSRLVDQKSGTTFYARTETRNFTADYHDLLYVDDLISVTTLKTDDNDDGTYEVTWTTSDYYLEPKNARMKSAEGEKEPYRQIRVNQNGDYSFPTSYYGIEIAGSWGYTTTPPDYVKQVVMLMANRIYRRKDAIFGVSGTPQLGVMTVQARIQEDTDIVKLMSGLNTRGFYA